MFSYFQDFGAEEEVGPGVRMGIDRDDAVARASTILSASSGVITLETERWVGKGATRQAQSVVDLAGRLLPTRYTRTYRRNLIVL